MLKYKAFVKEMYFFKQHFSNKLFFKKNIMLNAVRIHRQDKNELK